MPLPPVATMAACGSLITAIKSSWELSRMIKRKEQEKRVGPLGRDILRELRDVHIDGYMSERSFNKWYDRWLSAITQKDLPELLKIRAHIDLIHQDNKSHRDSKSQVSRRSTNTSSNSSSGKTSHRSRTRSLDRRHSSRVPTPVYTVEEYEEERHQPSYVDTKKAQSDWYHSHALPSPYSQGALAYTPEDDAFDESDKDRNGRSRRHHRDRHEGSHRKHRRSHSVSNVDRGRTRSRSVRTVTETTSSDADSEGESRYSRQRGSHAPDYDYSNDGRSKHESGRGR